ncbi:MAG: cytochrome c biogenesis CcdA family protein [Gaiellales bacterium]
MSLSITSVTVAFAAGFVSFISPCVWPLIPGYLSFVSGVPGGELTGHRRRVVLAAIGFVAGFSAIFTLAGAGSGVLGSQFLDHRRSLELLAGTIVVVMGLVMLVPGGALFQREWRPLLRAAPQGPFGASAAGAAFAIGWTPCIGTTLASILAIAGSHGQALDGALLLFAYSLGLGVPFLVAGIYLSSLMGMTRVLRDHWMAITRVSGAVLVGAGLLLASGRLTEITARLSGLSL